MNRRQKPDPMRFDPLFAMVCPNCKMRNELRVSAIVIAKSYTCGVCGQHAALDETKCMRVAGASLEVDAAVKKLFDELRRLGGLPSLN